MDPSITDIINVECRGNGSEVMESELEISKFVFSTK